MSHPAEPGATAGGPALGRRTIGLSAEPSSVPHARRFVRETLAGHDEDLRDRAEACISELVTNAVLHARTEVQVHVEDLGEAIRLEVRDRSTAMPRRIVHTVRSATGRGMEMVGLLARSWGVDLLEDDAKSVWCELLAGQLDAGIATDPEALLAAWPDGDELLLGPWDGELPPALPTQRPPSALEETSLVPGGADAPEERRPIVLRGYPVRLGIRAREHTSGVLRECALLSQSASTTAPAQLVALAEMLTGSYGQELAAIDEQRTAALVRGDGRVDLVYPAAVRSRDVVLAWKGAMEALDAYADSAALLSLATPPRLVELREWMVAEILRQSDGASPRPWTGPLD